MQQAEQVRTVGELIISPGLTPKEVKKALKNAKWWETYTIKPTIVKCSEFGCGKLFVKSGHYHHDMCEKCLKKDRERR